MQGTGTEKEKRGVCVWVPESALKLQCAGNKRAETGGRMYRRGPGNGSEEKVQKETRCKTIISPCYYVLVAPCRGG